MTYDTYGNIISKNGQTYFYDSTWHDLLTGIESESIEYDAQGNPTKYLGHTLVWEKGRQLKSFDGNTYTYNANGIRTSKTVNGVKHEYTLDGTKILKETWDDNTLIPLYDNEDSVCGIIYNDYAYYFLKNLQGDVIAITNNKGKVVASYTYDAWGVCTIVSDNTGIIARVNPFRYRSYYYDQEIGLYYLQSRYYDPQVGRFINGDDSLYLQLSENSNELNIFTYCYNNPVNMLDSSGKLPYIIKRYLNAVKGFIYANVFEIITTTNYVGAIGTASRIAITIKAISNYKSNRKKESKLTYTDGYINNQWDLTDWSLGYEELSKCGCEVISVYNALKACGKTHKLSELILYFEMCGYVMLYGYFGSNPTKLWKTFSSLNIKYESSFTLSTVESRLKNSKCGIVSCWNGKITKGLHTFMVIYDKSKKLFTSYNGYNNKNNPPYRSNKSLKNLVYSSQFIVGYSIK